VLCDGHRLTGWQVDCIDALETSGNAQAALLISAQSAAASRSNLLWRLFRKFVLDRSAAVRLQPLPQHLVALPVASDSRQESVRGHALDFILDCSSGEIPPDLAAAARLGVWTFRFGKQAKSDPTPPGFWDSLKGKATTEAALVRVGAQPGTSEQLWHGVFKTDVAFYRRLRNQLLRNAASWPARVARTWEDGRNLPLVHAASSTASKHGPSALDTIRFLFKMAGGLVAKVARRLFRHQLWRVGIIEAPVDEVAGLTASERISPPIRWLPNPQGRFLADPFAAEAGGDLLLLAEDYRWTTGLGSISGLRVSDEGATELQPVFELPYHMSYPYLFRHDGQLYCVPETNEAQEVALYVLDEHSLGWTKTSVLIAGRRLADSTMVEWNGRWWLFATDVEDDQVLNLHVWHAPALTGPWQEHAANPVKSDIRSSRPAGRPFVHEGVLYRPAQDCSEVYGGAVTINRVVELTPTQFHEEIASVIRPHKDWPARDGVHHLCGVADRTVIDACEEVFIWRATASVLLRKLWRRG
jgi:hypothetical protein